MVRGEQRFSSIGRRPGAGGPARLRRSGLPCGSLARRLHRHRALWLLLLWTGSKVATWPQSHFPQTRSLHLCSHVRPSKTPPPTPRARDPPCSPLVTRPRSTVLRSTDQKAPRLYLQVHCDSRHSRGTGLPIYPSPGQHLACEGWQPPGAREKEHLQAQKSQVGEEGAARDAAAKAEKRRGKKGG